MIAVSEQKGFVLVLTLWVMVIVSIAAAYFAERVTRSVELVQQSRQSVQGLIDMSSTRAEMFYRLGTNSMTEYGLGRGNTAISLDNRPYRGFGETVVQLQDNRGLLNLNLADDGSLQLFLGFMGIPADQRGRLIDTLHDYIDADNLRRLNGAEAEDYLALGLEPPPNRNLITPWEAARIIGWRDHPELWGNGKLVEFTTTGLSVGINPNTAPVEVLETIPGITKEIAQSIIAQRKLAPLLNEGQITGITGAPSAQYQSIGSGVIAIPSNAIRITQSIRGLPWAIQYNVTLTPMGKDAPWQIDYYTHINTNPQNAAQELPPRSTALPDKAPAFLTGE